MYWKTSSSIMECSMAVLYAILTMSSLAYANQGEPGLNERTLEEGHLPSSSLSSPVSSNVPGLINMTSEGTIKTNSIEGSPVRSSPSMMTRSTVVSTVRVSSPQSMISQTTVYSLSVETSVYLSSSVMPPLPTSSPLPGLPDPPVILDTNVLSAHSVLINWNTTTGQIISNYSVELSVNFSSWKNAVCNDSVVPGDCVVTQKQAVIIKLKPYTNYTFRVKARDQFGTSNYSTESKMVLTDEAAPSGAPSITAAHAISSQEIFVAWQPPPTETLNGKLQKYEIYVKKTTSVQPTTLPTRKVVVTTCIVHGTGSSARIPGVASLSSSFTSVPSTFKPTTPVRIPGVGSLSSSFTSVPSTLKPTTPGRAFPVTEPVKPTEELEEQRTDQSGSFGVIDAGLVLNYTIANLDKWTIYELKVRAVTIAPGPFSDKVIVRTNEDVPSQPLEVFAKTVNSTTIFVNWSEPAEMNGLLVKYQVKYSAKYSLESAMTKDVGQNNIVVLTSLNPFTPYVINVSAFTSKGEGSHASVEQLTDEGRPSTPQNLSAQSVSSTKIQVSWKSPVNTNGKVKYRLSFYNTSEPSAAAKLVYDGNATQYLVSNLMPYTLYTFQVTAYNVKYDLSSAAIDTVEKTDQAQPSGPPRNVRAVTNSSSSIILYWLPPSVDQQNGVIRSYNIEMRGGDLVYTTINTKSNSTTFPITGLQAYTNYEFILQALNDIGVGPYSSRVSSRTFEAEPSGPPRNVSAMTNSSSLIILYWLPPSVDQQNGVIRSYNIKIRGGDVIYPTINTKSNSTTFPITGLQAYTNYEFMLRAVNDIGVGPYSSRVSSRTFEAEPSSPRNVTAKSVNSTAIKVTWIKALYPNGIIYYQLYRRLSKEDEQKDQVVYQGTGTSHVAANLQEYVMYTFTAVSINIAHGWKSKPVVVMETTLPAEPTGPPQDIIAWTLSSTSILVKWSPPLPLEQNGVILRYTVSYRSQSSQWKSLDTADNSTSIEVKDLAIFTKYWFTVRALNVIGAGPESESVYNTTSEDKPSGPPRNVSAMTNSSSSIILSWLPPSVDQQNGVIKSYNIEMRGGDLIYTKINTRSNSTTLPITGLQAYTNYEFMLQAVNDIGVGPYSSRVSSRTFEAEPSSPRNVTAKTVNSTAIKVTWIKALHPNGIIYYRLYRRLSKEDEQKDQVVYQGTDTSHVAANLQEYVMYTFTVVSVNIRYGWQSKPVVVMETTHPAEPTGSPQDIIAWTLSSTSVLVKWSPPLPSEQNGVILRYTVSYRSQSSQWKSLDTADNSTSVEVKNLTIFTKYWFTVKALNVIGAGPESESVYNTTSEDKPSSPRNVTAKTVNSTAIKVTWIKALHPNGIIYYRLYRRLSKEDEQKDQVVYQGTDTSHVAANLQEYVMYTFTVVSVNIRYGWQSKPVVVMETTHPAEPTGPPQDIIAWTLSSTSVLVKWSPPLPSEQNGVILRYTVSYRSQSSQWKSLDAADNSTSIEVKNLTIFTKYWFTVRALNVIGAGPESESVYNTTSEDTPSPPVNIAAKTVNSTSIKVTWQAPLYPNGEICYRLYYWLSSEGVGTKRLAYDGPLLGHTVAGLHEYVTYTFMLQAYNVKYFWNSTATSATETTHPAEPSGPPLNVKALTMSSTSMLVKWSPPSELDRNGIITHYIVKYSSLNSESFINTTDNATQILVKSLRKYTNYSFTVWAVNTIGVGPPSVDDARNTTSEDVPGEPVIINVIPKTNSLEVTWEPPTEPNGVITTFRLCWKLLAGHNTTCVSLNGGVTQHEIRNLTAFSEYNVTLAAGTSIGLGLSFTKVYKTAEGVPSKPQYLSAWNTSAYSIFVTWKKPTSINGILKGYQVFSRLASDTGEPAPKNVGFRTNVTLSGLQPYRHYNVSVQALTGAGGGEKSYVLVMTDESAPSPVREVSIPQGEITWYSIEVTWFPPEKRNGEIGYYLSYWESSAGSSTAESFALPGSVHYKIVGGLKPFTNYTFSVVPYNLRKNLSGQPFIREGQTSATVPGGPPLNVKIVATTSESFTLTWDPPLEPNGIILGYDVMFYECDESNKKNIHDNIKEREHTIKNLHPYRCYRMYVACESSGGLGAYSDGIEHWTKPGVPPPLGTLAPPDKETIKSSSFIVELTQASNEMGVIGYYQVIVRELATDNRDQPVLAQDPEYYKVEDLYSYEEARKMKPQLVPYIAAEFRARDFDRYRSFVVGDGSRSSKVSEEISSRRKKRAQNTIEYYNGPLEENTFYAVFQRAYVNKDVYTSSSWIEPVETQFHVATKAAIERPSKPVVVQSSPSVGLIVGIVLIILILPIIIAAIYFVWRKRQNSDSVLDDREDFSNGRPMRLNKMSRKRRTLQKKRLMGSTESLGDLEELAASRARRHPVPIDDFERHVDRMHMDGDHGFSEEYLLVQPDEEFSFQQFLNPANKYKNRYANIVAYDHTRVLLNPIDGVPGSDYINANFLDGYNRQRAYIAAQGPLMETFDDFWRMIWEQMSSIIVMLTKLEERGRRKCDQYWPERGTRNYGQVQVTLKETLNMSHYTVRKLVMTHKMYPDDERVVRQFHFTAWPDHGVPSHPTPLLSLVRHTFSASRECIGPMVVHCSAGVGRTGTFITLDVMLQRISQEDSVDVFGFVRQMRYQRNFMVQTEAQYVFIHDALLEAITCGVTEVEAKDLGARIRELRQVDSETGYTYLENEFCRLAKEENHPTAFKSASLNCNASKNRYANILPFESTRVHLKMRPGEMGSDYINANFIDGYCQPKAYIATQAPVPDTFEDFWRMVWEQESAAVVMLTREEEAGKVKCHHYWPSEGSRLYGVILVELIEEGSFGDYISRKFKLTHTEEKDSRTICQFQYTDWPDTGLPDSGVGIVDLIGQVQKWQQQSGNTAIVLHCSGGVGRTGVFCGISIMIERLKAEGVIDVFQTVQAMRLQRPAMVQTAEQYEFCYTTLQEYLDSFDLYANFQ